MTLHADFGERTINELMLIFKNRQMNLEPGFQRKSVWSDFDRRRLIQSILSNYPVPCIFLYKNSERGRTVYDVIDGKQRLEAILRFTGLGRFKRDRFAIKRDVGEGHEWYEWPELRRENELRLQFEGYKIQTVEVTGDFNEIVDLFVRINSTGKRLSSAEKLHSKFYRSPFLKEADRLVVRFRKYLLEQKVLSEAQIDRMKGTELFAELLMSIDRGGPINKKISLDRAIGNDGVNGNTLHRLSREFIATMNLIRRMFPELKQTRFHNTVEFYSLFLLVWQMDRDALVLNDKKRNRIGLAILKRLSTGVDLLREQLRKAAPAKPTQRLFADYLLTVQGDTDSSANRERRADILRGLLWSLYDRKDDKRTFSAEQRRIIWNSDEQHRCVGTRCHHKKLTWEDFTVDHVLAYVKGGKTSLHNARLMCRSCNSHKGGR